jgi:hypothetical protein
MDERKQDLVNDLLVLEFKLLQNHKESGRLADELSSTIKERDTLLDRIAIIKEKLNVL